MGSSVSSPCSAAPRDVATERRVRRVATDERADFDSLVSATRGEAADESGRPSLVHHLHQHRHSRRPRHSRSDSLSIDSDADLDAPEANRQSEIVPVITMGHWGVPKEEPPHERRRRSDDPFEQGVLPIPSGANGGTSTVLDSGSRSVSNVNMSAVNCEVLDGDASQCNVSQSASNGCSSAVGGVSQAGLSLSAALQEPVHQQLAAQDAFESDPDESTTAEEKEEGEEGEEAKEPTTIHVSTSATSAAAAAAAAAAAQRDGIIGKLTVDTSCGPLGGSGGDTATPPCLPSPSSAVPYLLPAALVPIGSNSSGVTAARGEASSSSAFTLTGDEEEGEGDDERGDAGARTLGLSSPLSVCSGLRSIYALADVPLDRPRAPAGFFNWARLSNSDTSSAST